MYGRILKNIIKHAEARQKGVMSIRAIILWWLTYLTVVFVVGSICWTYSINMWLIWFGKAATVRWYVGGLIAFTPFVGRWAVACAVITFVASFFV